MNDATDFKQMLTQAILTGRSSEAIAREFLIRSETVRRVRRELRRAGHTIPKTEVLHARRPQARTTFDRRD